MGMDGDSCGEGRRWLTPKRERFGKVSHEDTKGHEGTKVHHAEKSQSHGTHEVLAKPDREVIKLVSVWLRQNLVCAVRLTLLLEADLRAFV